MAATVMAAATVALVLNSAGRQDTAGPSLDGTAAVELGSARASTSATTPSTVGPASAADSQPATSSPPVPEQPIADPLGIRIPTIDVEATMIPLGLQDDGTIEVPQDFDETGWWSGGSKPGEAGPAVILGHVDSRRGPAVFYRIRDLQPGDIVEVDRVDGTTVSYAVDRLEQHPKDAFPSEEVYGDVPEPLLRLVTCGGDFDSERRSYRDNIIVFAHMIRPGAATG